MDNRTAKLLALFQNRLRYTITRQALLLCAVLAAVGTIFQLSLVGDEFGFGEQIRLRDQKDAAPAPKALVVASMRKHDTNWIDELFPDWKSYKYVTDSWRTKYTVPKNKGREAMVYLTYIIDNYNVLPNLTVFIHGDRYQWHNDDPIYDSYHILHNLQLPYLMSNGYTNLRCVWTLGCPAELSNLTDALTAEQLNDKKAASNTALHFAKAFQELFPDIPLPKTVGVACCAQFAATREAIHSRSLSDYIHYRDWLLSTNLQDHVSGRVLEYSWHIIFGKEAVYCPDARDCYCKVFGYCELDCGDDPQNVCGDRWPFPPSATIPKHWPGVGWDGKPRTDEEIESLRWISYKNNSHT